MKRVSIVIPCLDPTDELLSLTESLTDYGFNDIIIINDGSSSECAAIFSALAEKPEVTVLTHEKNLGKGCALKTAFRYICENRPDSVGAVTADCDGQHRPEDILKIAVALCESEDKLVMGRRNFKEKSVPFRSRFGNKLTRTVLRISSGQWISDTQTGLRGIPKKYICEFCSVEGERYEYEMNILLYVGKQSIPVREVPIQTVYRDGNIGSKFNVVSDSLRIYRAFTFMISSLLSTLFELVLFTVLNFLLDSVGVSTAVKLLISTVSARICSSLLNYTINKKTVFHGNGRGSFYRYLVMWFFTMAASYGLVTGFVYLTQAQGIMKTVIKICVDSSLFFVGYFVQEKWVFKKNTNKTEDSK